MDLQNLSNRALGGIAGAFLALSIVAAIGIPKMREKTPIQVPSVIPDDFSVRVERRPGELNIVPQYAIDLRRDGSFVLISEAGGKGFAAQANQRTVGGQVGEANLRTVFAHVVMEELMKLPDEVSASSCPHYVTGGDLVTVSISMNGARKKVVHDVGCTGFPKHDELRQLELMVEKLADSPLCRSVPMQCQVR